MAVAVTHATVASGTDAGTGEIHKAEWNAGHTVTGLGTMAEQADTAVDINGGTIDGTVIGGTSAAAVTGTAFLGTSFRTTGATYELHIEGDRNANYIGRISNNNTSTPYNLQLYLGGVSNLTGAYFLVCGDTGGLRAVIRGSGSIASSSSFTPMADDGAILGSPGAQFSDIYLASGANISYAAGTCLLIHLPGTPPALSLSGTMQVSSRFTISSGSTDYLTSTSTNVTRVEGSGGSWPWNEAGHMVYETRGGATPRGHCFAMGATLATRKYLGIDGQTHEAVGGLTAVAGSAGSTARGTFRKTGIANNTATSIITVTVPNAAHNAAIFLNIVAHLGTGTDASESTRCARGCVVLARTAGVATVAAVSTLESAQIATVGGGGTLTLAYGVSAMTGATSATQTFGIQVTLVVTGTITDHTCVIQAELTNSMASGVTMAAA